MSRICGVYVIRNAHNGKAYVGRSVDIERRWRNHTRDAAKGSPYPIHCALRKYGADSFDWIVVAECAHDETRAKEREYINRLKTWTALGGYNIGSTEDSFPSREEMALMDEERRSYWKSVYSKASAAGASALAKLRLDENFEREYRKIKSRASVSREKNIRQKRLEDAAYDARISAARSRATSARVEGYQAAAGAAFSIRFATDPEYASKISANRKRANKASHVARRAAAALRKAGDATLS